MLLANIHDSLCKRTGSPYILFENCITYNDIYASHAHSGKNYSHTVQLVTFIDGQQSFWIVALMYSVV